MPDIEREFADIDIEYKTDEPLCRHSSFKIGGAADIVVFPKSENELVRAINLCADKGIKYTLIGNGSNVLFSDKGYRGAIIFTKRMNEFYVDEKGDIAYINALCGTSVARMAISVAEHGYSGLEFLCGIPATLGGAVYMNAGAYGSEMSDVLRSVRIYDTQKNEFASFTQDALGLSYRHSVLSEKNTLICVGAKLLVNKGNVAEIKERIEELRKKRFSSQPYELASAGSFFKRPEGYFAAKLIDDAGLKGLSVGGAEVSRKHAGFIVNHGFARAADVLELSELVIKKVYEKYGVLLEREVRYIEE